MKIIFIIELNVITPYLSFMIRFFFSDSSGLSYKGTDPGQQKIRTRAAISSNLLWSYYLFIRKIYASFYMFFNQVSAFLLSYMLLLFIFYYFYKLHLNFWPEPFWFIKRNIFSSIEVNIEPGSGVWNSFCVLSKLQYSFLERRKDLRHKHLIFIF